MRNKLRFISILFIKNINEECFSTRDVLSIFLWPVRLMSYWELKKTFKFAFLSRIAQRMRTVKECAEMENRRAKRARLLFFIFKFSKCSCHPLFVLVIYFKQRI